jgi:hypothetical protein
MSLDYRELDGAIIEHIKNNETHPANSATLEKIARNVSNCSVPWRIIDRRIQAMKKMGIIYLDNRKWVVNNLQENGHDKTNKP